MAIEISFVAEDQFVLIECRGKVTFKDIEVATGKGYALALTHRVFKFLADTRRTEPVMWPYEIYELPNLYSSTGFPRSSILAVVASEKYGDRENYRFFETVCKNNGYHYVETFETMEVAKSWLLNYRRPGS